MTYTAHVAGSETEQIVGQMKDAALHLISSNVDLVKRIANGGDPVPPRRGPAQDVWMTWAESAGDLVTITYLAAQLLDTLGGTREAPPQR